MPVLKVAFFRKGSLSKGPKENQPIQGVVPSTFIHFSGDITWKGYLELSPMVNQIHNQLNSFGID